MRLYIYPFETSERKVFFSSRYCVKCWPIVYISPAYSTPINRIKSTLTIPGRVFSQNSSFNCKNKTMNKENCKEAKLLPGRRLSFRRCVNAASTSLSFIICWFFHFRSHRSWCSEHWTLVLTRDSRLDKQFHSDPKFISCAHNINKSVSIRWALLVGKSNTGRILLVFSFRYMILLQWKSGAYNAVVPRACYFINYTFIKKISVGRRIIQSNY